MTATSERRNNPTVPDPRFEFIFFFFLKKKINDIRERDKEENEARDLTVAHRIVVSL